MNQDVELNQVFDVNEKTNICEQIIRGLPNWFGIEKAILDYVRGVADTHFLLLLTLLGH